MVDNCITCSWCFYPKQLTISAFHHEGSNPEQQESCKFIRWKKKPNFKVLHVSATGTYREQQAEAGSDATTLQQRSLVPAPKLYWHLLCVSPLCHRDKLVSVVCFFFHFWVCRMLQSSSTPPALCSHIWFSQLSTLGPSGESPQIIRSLSLGHLRSHMLFLRRKHGGSAEFGSCLKTANVDTLQKTRSLQQWTTDLQHVSRFEYIVLWMAATDYLQAKMKSPKSHKPKFSVWKPVCVIILNDWLSQGHIYD